MRGLIAAAFVAATLAAPGAVLAAGSMSDSSDVTIGDVKRLVERGSYSSAISKAEEYLQTNPRSADAYNYIGYSNRKLARYDRAKSAYDRALAIDPSHVGAHEYYGELHITLGDLDGAKKHLADLTRICGNCAEQQELSAKVAKAQAGG